jgi:NADH:ubiquinone oxidoreductase subunit F (NADH-binding)
MSAAGLREAGASLGAGALVVLPAGACALRETARVMRWLSGESAGQCGPCVFGLRALAEAATALAGGARASEALREMRRLPGEVERRGACAHPDGAARLARSALAAFPDEVRHHLDGCCAGAAHPDVLPIPDAPTEWR